MSHKSVTMAKFIGYMGIEVGKPVALYNVGVNTWSAQTLKEKGIRIPETPTPKQWERERR